MANFEGYCWVISSSINLLFLKSVLPNGESIFFFLIRLYIQIHIMDTSTLFATVRPLQSRSDSYSIDYCPSSILLGNRFHIFHPLKWYNVRVPLGKKCVLFFFPTEKNEKKKERGRRAECQEEFVTFLLLVCKNPIILVDLSE